MLLFQELIKKKSKHAFILRVKKVRKTHIVGFFSLSFFLLKN